METNENSTIPEKRSFREYLDDLIELSRNMSYRVYDENRIETSLNELLTASISFDIHTSNLNVIEISEDDETLITKITGFLTIYNFRKKSDEFKAQVKKHVVVNRELLTRLLKAKKNELENETQRLQLEARLSGYEAQVKDLEQTKSKIRQDQFFNDRATSLKSSFGEIYIVDGYPVSERNAQELIDARLIRLNAEIEEVKASLQPIDESLQMLEHSIEKLDSEIDSCHGKLDKISLAIFDLEIDFDNQKQASVEESSDLLREGLENLELPFAWMCFGDFDDAKDYANDLHESLVALRADLDSRLSNAESLVAEFLANGAEVTEELKSFTYKIAESKMIIDLMISTASELQIQIKELEDIE